MITEINKAVEIFQKIAFGTKQNLKKIPEAKLAALVLALTDLLKVRYEKNWYPNNPDRGSGYRCIRNNGQSIDPTVVESFRRAKIRLTKDLIMTELTIWVDPGVVSVRIGEDGSIGSEVVDEDVYNISQRTNKLALDSDEELSSRSSSPEYMSSDSSRSTSPASSSSSPVPAKFSASPSPAANDNDIYYQSTQASYPSLYHRSSPLAAHLLNQSPLESHRLSNGVTSQSRPTVSFGPTMMPLSNRDIYSQSGYTPSTSTVRAAFNHQQRNMISGHENITSSVSQDGSGKMAYNFYQAMPMLYGGNLQQRNFCDIPAMA